MDKSQPAFPQHYAAAVRWVELTVAHAMVRRGDVLDKERRRQVTLEIVGRWRGNRPPTWQPTVEDLDNLFDATLRWTVQQTPTTLFG